MREARIIQLSDTHLFGSPEGRLLGSDTNGSFMAVLEHISATDIQPDCLLITGDLTQDHSLASYQWLKKQLDDLGVDYFWLCGNHDDTELMHQASPAAMQKRVQRGHWQIILMDSHIPGAIPGELNEQELSFLQQSLSDYPNHHSLLAIHHPPYQIGSRWLDEINLRNADRLQSILSNHDNVRAVINGHIHQTMELQMAGIRYLSTPSTCVQFKPESENFTLDEQFPGYRVLDLHENGHIETKVVRVEHGSIQLDMTSNGY